MRRFGWVLGVLLLSSPSGAWRTPFGDARFAAAERGLTWLEAVADGPGLGEAQGLALWALLQRADSADLDAPRRGHRGASEAAQARHRRIARALIDETPGLGAGPANVWRTSAALLGLAAYLQAGGANEVGADRTVAAAIEQGAVVLLALRGQAGCNVGGWNDGVPRDDGDVVATAFARMGLSAATAALPGLEVEPAEAFLAGVGNADGGFHSRGCRPGASTLTQTAAGAVLALYDGLAPEHPLVQGAVAWMLADAVPRPTVGDWRRSTQLARWLMAHGLARVEGRLMVPGRRAPAADGYPEGPRDWRYDLGWAVMADQAPSGRWQCLPGTCWRPVAATAYAVMVLSMPFAALCDGFEDQDGICGAEDNCPQVPNVDQADMDGDGRGDVCDNCPGTPNADQSDGDGDGLGDVCDGFGCLSVGSEVCDGTDDDCDGQIDEQVPFCDCDPPSVEQCNGRDDDCDGYIDEATGADWCRSFGCVRDAPEICDGLDNNCDGRVDNSVPGLGDACVTEQVGRCAEGRVWCSAEGLECRARAMPIDEVCDGVDQDCDGAVDEGAAGQGAACAVAGVGRCATGQVRCVAGALGCSPWAAAAELCNGLDDDCDGVSDEAVVVAGGCLTGHLGACRPGALDCVSGGATCLTEVRAEDERCDGADEDCDGVVDESPICVVDAGVVDAGGAPDAAVDAGDAAVDAGDAEVDAGDAEVDAGDAEVDAGDAVVGDHEGPPPDGAPDDDAQADAEYAPQPRDGCAQAPAATSSVWWLLGLVGVLRRRRAGLRPAG
jgi:hypothetical protein